MGVEVDIRAIAFKKTANLITYPERTKRVLRLFMNFINSYFLQAVTAPLKICVARAG